MIGTRNIFSVSATALLASVVFLAGMQPVEAKKRGAGAFVSGLVGGLIGGAIINEMTRGEKESSQGRKQQGSSGGGSGGSRGESQDTIEARKRANANAAQLEAAMWEIYLNETIEKNRNVDAAITEFIELLEQEHRVLRKSSDANVRVSTGPNINQVTAGEIRVSIERAYTEAQLTDFDSLTGELWTRDRLLVQILHEARTGILPYFQGVGAKGPDVANLQQVFKEAAATVYARALELSDIIGVSFSFDRFIRTIYENSDRAPQGLWTVGADLHYERLLTRVINGVDQEHFSLLKPASPAAITQGQRLAQLFQFRFRARRTLYDCLAASYLDLTGGGGSGGVQIPIQAATPIGGERGVRVEVTDRMPIITPTAAGQDGPGAAFAATAGSSTEVWKRTQQFVGDKCRTSTVDLAMSTQTTALKPISARWNSAAGSQKPEGQYLQIRLDEQPR